MKKLVLFLSLLFVGVAGQFSIANAEVAFANEDCVDCAKIADWVVKDIPDGYKNKDQMWQSTYDFCMENEDNPCKKEEPTPIASGGNRTVKRTITINP